MLWMKWPVVDSLLWVWRTRLQMSQNLMTALTRNQTRTNKHCLKTQWLLQAFISITSKSLDNKISLVMHLCPFEFAIKMLRSPLNAIFFKIVTLKCSMKLKYSKAIEWCPNHGWKHSKWRRKYKFKIFSTRGRRSTKVRGWFRETSDVNTACSSSMAGGKVHV